MRSKFVSKLLRKNAYGLDVSGMVSDAEQDNIRDLNNPHRNPNKDLDWNPCNMTTDSTIDQVEAQEISRAKLLLNPME